MLDCMVNTRNLTVFLNVKFRSISSSKSFVNVARPFFFFFFNFTNGENLTRKKKTLIRRVWNYGILIM